MQGKQRGKRKRKKGGQKLTVGKCPYESGSLPARRYKIRSPQSPGFTRRYLSPNRRIVEWNARVTADITQRDVGEGLRASGWISVSAGAST